MLAWAKQINADGNVDSRIIIRWPKVMQQATLININPMDINHIRTTAMERSIINHPGA